MNNENNILMQKSNEIQEKNDVAVACLGNETARTNQIHHAHSKLLSIRLLDCILSAQVAASQQKVFE